MTVSSENDRFDAVGTGSTDTFSFNFKILDEAEIRIITVTDDVEEELTLTTDYTITGVGDDAGGTVILTAGNLANGATISGVRNMVFTQETDLQSQGEFSPASHETVFDRLTMMAQQLKEANDRVFSLSAAVDPDDIDLELPPPEAGTVLGWNDDEDGIENVDVGSVALAIPADNSVTTAKILNANVTTAKIADDNVTLAKLAEQAALTVLANATNATANPTAVAAGTDGFVFRRNGTALDWGVVTYAGLTGTLGILDYNNPIAVTGTVTATINRLHVCTGTSSDYTVTLPAVSGNTGKVLGFVMGTTAALTKMVTLDGSGAETINGSASRVMWSNEVAVLYCNGTEWIKIGGKSIPMVGVMQRTTSQAISDVTETKVQLGTSILDVGSICDAVTNYRITARRAGYYRVLNRVHYASGATATLMRSQVNVNAGATAFAVAEMSMPNTANHPSLGGAVVLQLGVGDFLESYTYHNSGAPRNISDLDLRECRLSVEEINVW